jgi:excinuclease UvrABC ATPase subunit
MHCPLSPSVGRTAHESEIDSRNGDRIYDYLRLLFARVGRTYCRQCGNEVKKDTVDEVAGAVLRLGEGTRLQVFFPLDTQEPIQSDDAQGKARTKKPAARKTAAVRSSSAKPAGQAAIPDLLKTRLFELRKRLQSSLPERPGFRIFHTRIVAGRQLCRTGFCARDRLTFRLRLVRALLMP